MGRAERQSRRAARKEARAIRKRAKGKNRRANKLEARAEVLRTRSGIGITAPRVMIDSREYSPTIVEAETVSTAFGNLRTTTIKSVKSFLGQFDGLSDDDIIALWNGTPTAFATFGSIDDAKYFGSFARRVHRIISTLETRAIFVKLENAHGKTNKFGVAMPSLFNRPFSKNVRFKIYLNNPAHNVTEMMGTIIHEIGHTIVLPSPDPNQSQLVDQNLNQSFRTPRRYEEFFLNI